MAKAQHLDDAALAAELRRVGLRATPSRIGVLGTLRAAGGPRSHAEVADALAGQPWDRATIYRNLIDLVDGALARRTDVDHVWRFEAIVGEGVATPEPHPGHPHFVCTVCGEIECLPEIELVVKKAKAPRAIRAKQVEVQVRGRCDACS